MTFPLTVVAFLLLLAGYGMAMTFSWLSAGFWLVLLCWFCVKSQSNDKQKV